MIRGARRRKRNRGKACPVCQTPNTTPGALRAQGWGFRSAILPAAVALCILWQLKKHRAFAYRPSLQDPPRRRGLPAFQLFQRPLDRLIRVAGGAGVGNAELLGQPRGNEPERMAADKLVTQFLCDERRMARRALASGAAFRMVRMLGERHARARLLVGTVAAQAERIAPVRQIGRVLVAMHLVAVEAADVPVVHDALRIIVALHAILMSRAVGEIIEAGLARLAVFELPEIDQPLSR